MILASFVGAALVSQAVAEGPRAGVTRSAGGSAASRAATPRTSAAVRPPRGAAESTPHPAPERRLAHLVARASEVERLPRDFDVRTARLEGEHFVADLEGGGRAELTLEPGLQRHVARELARYDVPYGALVAIDPSNGRVLAHVSHSSADPDAGDLALDASAPAASVFKIITTAALLDRGVAPSTRVCYGGGLHGITLADLDDDAERDSQCATLTEALGGSINAVFAKLADRRLDRATLGRYADAFGFGQTIPFDLASRPSAIDVPDERLEFARTAAGFWHSHLSPLHGALVAATVANHGTMPRIGLVERILDADGRVVARFEPGAFRSVIGVETAHTLAHMMQRTVHGGTARSAFFDPQGNPFLPGIRVAGKTGTLNQERPDYRGYTWFVGFAPADHPTIAVASLVVNSPEWRIKASYLAREALRYYLVERPRLEAAAVAAAAARSAAPPSARVR